MNEATINARINPTLKQHGMAVLEQNSTSVTEAIRKLFEYMEKNQALPPCLAQENADESPFEHRRALMRSFVGIIPQDATIEEAREARLAGKGL